MTDEEAIIQLKQAFIDGKRKVEEAAQLKATDPKQARKMAREGHEMMKMATIGRIIMGKG